MRQLMQETLYQDRRCRSLSIRHQMQDFLLQTADAGVSVSDSGCRRYTVKPRLFEVPGTAGILSNNR